MIRPGWASSHFRAPHTLSDQPRSPHILFPIHLLGFWVPYPYPFVPNLKRGIVETR